MTVVRPTRSPKGNMLDMRVSDKLGVELKDEIEESVARTQLFIIQELPNILMLNTKQFVSLTNYTEEMFNSKDRLFRTPHNIMEVEVKDD